jgi:hypothetical protein
MAEMYFIIDPVVYNIMRDNANFFEHLAIGVQTVAMEDDSQVQATLLILPL